MFDQERLDPHGPGIFPNVLQEELSARNTDILISVQSISG